MWRLPAPSIQPQPISSSSSHRVPRCFLSLLCALCLLTCLFPARVQTDELASLTADQRWDKVDTLLRARDFFGARPIYGYIVAHHVDNESPASWALYRLCSISRRQLDIDAAVAHIQRAVHEFPTSGIATQDYAAACLTAIRLLFKKDYHAGIHIGEGAGAVTDVVLEEERQSICQSLRHWRIMRTDDISAHARVSWAVPLTFAPPRNGSIPQRFVGEGVGRAASQVCPAVSRPQDGIE